MDHRPDRAAWGHRRSEAEQLEYHMSMVFDATRMAAYEKAIHRAVQPGDVVVDIGAGTGILSFLACEAGAARVYAIEGGAVVDVARELCERNGFSDRVVFVNEWSTAAELPEPADVLITETIGNAAIDEGIIAWTIDARRRLLRPGGVVLPQRVGMWIAGVEAWDDHSVVSDWTSPSLPVDYRAVGERAAKVMWFAEFGLEQLVTGPASVADLDLTAVVDETVTGTGELTVSREGTVHGLACWFDADLFDGLALSNAPPSSAPSWVQGYLPTPQPMEVNPGDRLAWRVAVSPDGEEWSWDLSPA